MYQYQYVIQTSINGHRWRDLRTYPPNTDKDELSGLLNQMRESGGLYKLIKRRLKNGR